MTLADIFQPRLVQWTRGVVIDDDDELFVAPSTYGHWLCFVTAG